MESIMHTLASQRRVEREVAQIRQVEEDMQARVDELRKYQLAYAHGEMPRMDTDDPRTHYGYSRYEVAFIQGEITEAELKRHMKGR